ncbi:MAG: GTP-binding protein [Lachnospiraceae bacterium]
MTKITIVSGFLGAGKTTLINKLLKETCQGKTVAVIENEFGKIAVDENLLQNGSEALVLMGSGCICCNLAANLKYVIEDTLQKLHPDRIFIEPGGAAGLTELMKLVRKMNRPDVYLTGCLTVVHAKKHKVYMKNFGEFYVNQIRNADAILLSHCLDVAEERKIKCIESLQKENPSVVLFSNSLNQISGVTVLEELDKRSKME